jgi:hypothetical protein
MRNRRLAVGVVVVLVAAIAFWWNRGRQGDTPATPTVTQHAGSARDQRRFAICGTASLEVTVRDGRGVLAGATVRLAPEDGDVMLLKTDANGIALAKVAPGTYEISASAPDHEPAALPDEELASGEAAKLAVTLVAGGRTLSGTVTDVSGGPVGGVRIVAAKLGGARPSSAIATTTTGGDGKYKLTVAEGQLLVAARSPATPRSHAMSRSAPTVRPQTSRPPAADRRAARRQTQQRSLAP